VDEESLSQGRNVKKRAERNEEILNWRKLQVSVIAPLSFYPWHLGCFALYTKDSICF